MHCHGNMDSEWMQEDAKHQTLEEVRILFHVLASTFLLLWADFVPQLVPSGYYFYYMYFNLNKVIVIVVQTKIELYQAHSSSMAQQSPKIKIPGSTPAFTWLLLIHFPFAVRISVLESIFPTWICKKKPTQRQTSGKNVIFHASRNCGYTACSKKTRSPIQYAGWLLYQALIILTHVEIKNYSRTVYIYAVL